MIKSSGTITPKTVSEIGPASGLVAWYPLKNDTQDYTINRNDGTNNGAVLADRGYSFDGISQYISAPPEPNIWDTDTTVAWWEYDLSTSNKIPISIGMWTVNGAYIHRNASVTYAYTGPLASNMSISGLMATTNEWNHYAIRYVKSTLALEFYKNGALVASKTIEGAIIPNTYNVNIGTYNADANWMCDCKLSDIRIYNRALSLEEINILYEITDPTTTQRMKVAPSTVYVKGQFKEVAT